MLDPDGRILRAVELEGAMLDATNVKQVAYMLRHVAWPQPSVAT